MDPDAALKAIDDFIRLQQEGEEVDDYVESLRAWISGGGFHPKWAKYELGTEYFVARTGYVQRSLMLAVKQNGGKMPFDESGV